MAAGAQFYGGTQATLAGQLHAAFAKPLHQRCIDVAKIIDNTSLKELHSIIPLLISNIFGFNNQPGWGIGRISKSHYQDYVSLRQFFAPQGPLLQLVYKLLHDPYCRYEFPVSCLPLPSKCSIEEGNLPSFYHSKVQIHHTGRAYGMLSLNAFEYYFFHFAYFLIASNMHKVSAWHNPSEALYANLVEDYLGFFLPINGKMVPAMPQVASPVRSTITHSPTTYRNQSPSKMAAAFSRNSHFPSLFKNLPSPRALSPQTNIQSESTEQQETWRSQTFLQILMEFWFSQSLSPNEQMHRRESWCGRVPPNSSYGPYEHSHHYIFETFLPSGDHVRIARMAVKHLHYFANSARPEMTVSPYTFGSHSPWDEFKRAVWPQFAQKKTYTFLKHGFEKWPLDSSFRLMLEMWLSYLQPFRYTDPSQAHHADKDNRQKVIEKKWQSFVTDNLLFYSVLLQDVLPRFFRMDLSSPKNAYMLFRLTKVFNLPNLREMIREAEEKAYHIQQPIVSNLDSSDLGQSYNFEDNLLRHRGLNHSQNQTSVMPGVLLSEFESVGFQYTPLFSNCILDMTSQLQMLIAEAQKAVKSSQQKSVDGDSGLMAWLFGKNLIDYNATSFSSDGFEDSEADFRKTEHYLTQAQENISNFFQLRLPEQRLVNKNVTWGNTQQIDSIPDVGSPDHLTTDEGPKLTPLGRYQLMNGLKKFDIDYSGDIELQPIRSSEIAFLVRAFHHLADFLNQCFANDLSRLLEREDFLGSVAYQFLSPKRSSKTILVPKLESSRPQLPESRIRLRWLASKPTLGYFLAFYVFMYLWFGIGFFSYLLLLLILIMFSGVFRAFIHPRPRYKFD